MARRLIAIGAVIVLDAGHCDPGRRARRPQRATAGTTPTPSRCSRKGPTPDPDLVNGWGISRLPDEPVVGRGQRHGRVHALQGRRLQAGAEGRDPRRRADRHGLQHQRRRFPRRPVPVRQRGRRDLRLARRAGNDRRGRQRRPRRGRRLQGPRHRDGRRRQGHGDLSLRHRLPQRADRRLRQHVRLADVVGRLHRPEAPQGLCAVRHPEPQGIAVRDVREDAAGERRRARRPGPRRRRCLPDRRDVLRSRRQGRRRSTHRGAWPGRPTTSVASAATSSSATSATASSTPIPRTATAGTRTARCGAPNHRAVMVDGLWGIAFGGGAVNNGPTNTLFFAAGPNDEEGGAFGTIDATH